MKNISLFGIIGGIFFLTMACSCNRTNVSSKDKGNQTKTTGTKKQFSIVSPKSNVVHKQTSSIRISWEDNGEQKLDSIVVSLNDHKRFFVPDSSKEFTYEFKNQKTGRHNVRIAFHSNSQQENHLLPIKIHANKAPKQLSYNIIRKFHHDAQAYTQGLFIYNDTIYESTGQYGLSSLRKVDISTGEILKKYDLEDRYFGEGIAKVKDKIYMLTFRSGIGFVFDFNTFKLMRDFDLQTAQGWGLTSYDDKLLLSDGSSNLRLYVPESFTTVDNLQVYNDKGPERSLNELEYTPYGIFANVYIDWKKEIMVIDPQTGAVTHKLDCSSLFPNDIPDDSDHILNGIAWNENSNTFFVTGKNWPIMYELQLSGF
ncbi:MAG: glutaminyl-peptide cyclotransferase [Bacteroidales bacterium]|nr:glutaminyl-peptide cyclotransferase [Bacteroidales bacterium]